MIESLDIPNDIRIEQSVISAMINDYESCTDALPIISEHCFFNDFCRKIYTAIIQLSKKGMQVELMSLSKTLANNELMQIIDIASISPTSLHVVQHSKILYELQMRRELIRLSDYIRTNSYNKNNDVFNIIDYVQATCQKMYVFENSSVTTINESIDGVFEVIDKNRQSKQSLIGTGTGISKFDEFSGGLQSSDLIVIAGETSQGKTSLALTMAKNAAMNFNAKVVFYSLEMSKIQLTARLMAQETEVNSKRILVYPLNDETVKRISEKTWKLAGSSIYFDDNISTNAESIYRSIRMMSKKYGINIVVIDYLQLMSGDKSSTKEQQTGAIVNTLKSIAKDLNICVILLSQLSRSDSPEPSLRRLRDSGQIEQAADIVIFTYRPEVYGREYPKEFREFTPYDTAMIDVAKGRNIGITRFIVSFKKETTLYYDYDGGYFNPQQEKRPF